LLAGSSLSRSAKRLEFARGARDGEVVGGLEVEPELGGSTERLRQEPGRLGGYAAFAADELIDSLNGNSEVSRQGHLRLTKGDKELLEKDLARMGRNAMRRLHAYPRW
jgi:hypothetical protein